MWNVNPNEAAKSFQTILRFIGEDPQREGLEKTPLRYIKALQEMTAGYKMNAREVLGTVFSEPCDKMVVLRDIEFTSLCEHHVLPFIGVAHVGYIPRDKIVGISKLARLVDMYALRLQIQERMTGQITSSLMEVLNPQGAACVVQAKHMCMACRGVRKASPTMVTASLTGSFYSEPDCRDEFYKLAGMGK